MRIPFTKAHGAKNDFLLTWTSDLAAGADLPSIAQAICDRHTGAGGDGWLLVAPQQNDQADGTIRLFNPDGSEPEISGNGTRCAAALLADAGHAAEKISIQTGAGLKHLLLRERNGHRFVFEMNMGRPQYEPEHVRYALPLASGPVDATIVYVGNPQCAVFVNDFPENWIRIGAEIERHQLFPRRTNVSFVRVVDPHIIEVRFFERGVGETMSSGTGSTGAAAAALLRGLVQNPVTVQTPAGPLALRWDEDVFLTGPAEIVAEGVFFFQ